MNEQVRNQTFKFPWQRIKHWIKCCNWKISSPFHRFSQLQTKAETCSSVMCFFFWKTQVLAVSSLSQTHFSTSAGSCTGGQSERSEAVSHSGGGVSGEVSYTWRWLVTNCQEALYVFAQMKTFSQFMSLRGSAFATSPQMNFHFSPVLLLSIADGQRFPHLDISYCIK